MAISQQLNFRRFVPLLFVPAGMGIFFKIAFAQSLPERLLAAALLLFCPELARMAKVDLDNIVAVTSQSSPTLPVSTSALPTPLSFQQSAQLSEDSRLSTFYKIVVSTIVLELLGFYVTWASLQWGGIVIIFSQLWFNLLAKVQLFPRLEQSITSFELLERLPVLAANVVGLALLAFWPVCEIRLGLSIALLILIVLFLLIKYALPIASAGAEQNAPNTLENKASGD